MIALPSQRSQPYIAKPLSSSVTLPMIVFLLPRACRQPQQIETRLSLIKACGRMDDSIIFGGSGNSKSGTTLTKEREKR